MHAGAGPHVHDVVGGEDRLAIVLHDEDGVAEVAEPDLRLDEPGVVACVQADRRLVEDVEDADERSADLRREPDALPFAARERLRAPVEREVVETDVDEEPEARRHRPEQGLRHGGLARRELLRTSVRPERREERAQLLERHPPELGDVLLSELHRQSFGTEAAALARRARPRDEEAADLVVADRAFVLVEIVEVVPDRGGAVVFEARLEALHDADVVLLGCAATAGLAFALAVAAAAAEEERLLGLVGLLVPRLVGIDTKRFDRARELGREGHRSATAPREDDTLAERALRIADHALRIDDRARAETVARRAGAMRSVEGEHPRLDRRERDAAVDAGEALGQPEGLLTLDRDEHPAFACLQRELDAVGEASLHALLEDDAIDDDIEIVRLATVELDRVSEIDDGAVDASADEAVAPEPFELELQLALARTRDRREHAEA